MVLSSHVTDNLKKTVEAACADPKTSVPGTSVVVVSKDGTELFAHAAGKRGVTSAEDMTLDSVFWIASCTKMIAGLACMQLVEQGKLHLDDGDETERLVPELKATKVLQKDGTLVEKNKKITLRMLLTHTGAFVCSVKMSRCNVLIQWHSWLRLFFLQRRCPQLLASHWLR